MTIAILGAITAIVTLAISIFAYITNEKTKIRKLKDKLYELEKQLRVALAKNDTVTISQLSCDIEWVRSQLANLDAK